MKTYKLLATALLMGTSMTPVFAQEVESEAGGIQDIVVTAQRREERLQNVPIAVTAIGSVQLANSGISTTQDLTAVTPALNIGQNGGNALPRLRGIGASFGGPGIENSIATYVDGVYIAAAQASTFSLTGIERIEVLKGPQGTLFGRNATGGLIQVITKKPSEVASGAMSLSYGNYDTVSGDFYLTGGLAPGLAMDVAAHASFQGDGYGRNLNLNRDTNRADRDLAYRAQIQYTGDTTSVRLAADYAELVGSPFTFRQSPYDVSTMGPSNPGKVWDTNGDTDNFTDTKSYGASLTVNQELPFADLVSITAIRRAAIKMQIDADTTPTEGLNVYTDEFDKQFSQELQLVSKPESPIKWMLGGYFFDAKSRYKPNILYFSPFLQFVGGIPYQYQRVNSLQSTRSYAVFGQTTVPLGEATNLTVGLRYTSERKGFNQLLELLDGSFNPVFPDGIRNDRVKYKKLTWRLSLDHRFTPGIMAYASVNRGFKSGGFNPAGGIADAPFSPEQLDAYEVGVKADLLGRKLRFNPSFFYYDYKNMQVTTFTPQALPIFINGPSAKIYGLDLDFIAQPTEALTIRGGLTLIHDRFGDFPNAPFNYSNKPLPGGFLVFANAKGNRISYTSDWVSTIAADYVIPTSFGKVTLSGTYNHNDGYYFELDNLRRQRAHDVVNGTIRIENESGSLYASIWGRNLLNEEIALQVQGSPNFGGSAQFGPPRTYGVTIGTKF